MLDIKTYSDFTCALGLFIGYIFAFVYAKILTKINTRNVKLRYSNDTILKIYKTHFIVILSFAIAVGSFTGGFILPFFVLNDVTNIKTVTQYNLFYYCFIEIMVAWFFLSFLSHTYFITDKRVLSVNPFKPNPFFKTWSLLYSEIKKADLSNEGRIYLYEKENKKYDIPRFKENKNNFKIIIAKIQENKEE